MLRSSGGISHSSAMNGPRATRVQLLAPLLLIPAALVCLSGSALLALNPGANANANYLSDGLIVIALLVTASVWQTVWLPRADPMLLPLVGALVGVGMTIVMRVAPVAAGRQVIWLGVGIVVFSIVVANRRPILFLAGYRYTMAALGVALLAITIVFGIDPNDSGVRIWLGYGGYNFQPSELIKVALVIFLAGYLTEMGELLGGPSAAATAINGRALVAYLAPIGAICGLCLLLLLFQRDLGPAVLFYAVTLTMLYLATARRRFVLLGLLAFFGGGALVYRFFSVARIRIDIWLDPYSDAAGRGYQLIQGIVAFASGGLLGVGAGLGYPEILPAAMTDFPLAVIGEEFGFVATLAIVGIFAVLTLRGFAIAYRAKTPFSQLLAAGLTSVLALQALIIMGGNLRILPLTGITLPFISYGGSSLVTNWLIVALLARISSEKVDGA